MATHKQTERWKRTGEGWAREDFARAAMAGNVDAGPPRVAWGNIHLDQAYANEWNRLAEGTEQLAKLRTGETLAEGMARLEASIVHQELVALNWARAETANRLGVTREGLWRKMKRFGIEAPPEVKNHAAS
jgi:DNA-binding NtrC family response regulator